jgi:hypothetical protein
VGIRDIHLLFPTDETPEDTIKVTILSDGIFQVQGSDDAVKMVDATHFQLSTSLLTELGGGAYSVTSG